MKKIKGIIKDIIGKKMLGKNAKNVLMIACLLLVLLVAYIIIPTRIPAKDVTPQAGTPTDAKAKLIAALDKFEKLTEIRVDYEISINSGSMSFAGDYTTIKKGSNEKTTTTMEMYGQEMKNTVYKTLTGVFACVEAAGERRCERSEVELSDLTQSSAMNKELMKSNAFMVKADGSGNVAGRACDKYNISVSALELARGMPEFANITEGDKKAMESQTIETRLCLDSELGVQLSSETLIRMPVNDTMQEMSTRMVAKAVSTGQISESEFVVPPLSEPAAETASGE